MKFSRTNYPKNDGQYWALLDSSRKAPIVLSVNVRYYEPGRRSLGFHIDASYVSREDYTWDRDSISHIYGILWGDKFVPPKISIEREGPVTENGIEIPLTIKQKVLVVGWDSEDRIRELSFEYYNKKTGVASYRSVSCSDAFRKLDEHNVWYTIDEVYATRIDGITGRLEAA